MLVVTAVHTFIAEHGDELDFQVGEKIEVLEKDDAFGDGWWRGRNAKGEEGLFPATYITEPTPDPIAPAPDSPKAPPIERSESPTSGSNGIIETAASGLGAAAVGVSNVMGKTIGEIQNAIENISKPEPESDEEEGELGIDQNARARLAQQAKIANESRGQQRVSGGVAGLVYSDESDDEEPNGNHAKPALLASAIPTTPPTLPPIDRPAVVPSSPPNTWSVEDVVDWGRAKGFEEAIWRKFQEHEISGDLLLELDVNLLKELDIPQFGKRLRVSQAIQELRKDTPGALSMTRGMSAPPLPVEPMPPTPPADQQSRKSSSIQMDPIRESTPTTSIPASPVTPSSTTKRESSGSIGHKRGKGSFDTGKERLSFFGRSRKPPPSTPSSVNNKMVASTQMHQMQPDEPVPGEAIKQIGKPDHSGYLKKKGERMGWNNRYFVLKGNHLYWMKSDNDDRVKGHIALTGHRVIVDENTNPGFYGFRLVGSDKSAHFFSSSDQKVIREWMKALIKATINRDYSVPVTSSCNIPTIPLAEAQALSPRPPSPATREATQRATRRENTNTLTAHDASILMSLDNSKRKSQLGDMPRRPSRDMRRPSTIVVDYTDKVDWVNKHLPEQYPRAAALPASFVSGEVIFLLVRALSQIEPNPPVPPTAFSPEKDGLPGIEGLFSMMDILIDAGIDTAGVSINDIRTGDAAAIARLVTSIQGKYDPNHPA